jgi:hypothetical protein
MHFKKQKNIPENACQLGTIRVCNVKSERRQNTEKATAYQEENKSTQNVRIFLLFIGKSSLIAKNCSVPISESGTLSYSKTACL